MQIILVNGGVQLPGFGRYPGCYRLATELRNNGFRVQVIDFFHRLKFNDFYRLVESLIDNDTLFVGWSSTFSMQILGKRKNSNKQFQVSPQYIHRWPEIEVRPFYFSYDEMQRFKDLLNRNQIKFVVGGSEDKRFYDNYDVDYFFYGQADKSIIEFARVLKEESTPKCRIEIGSNGKIRKTLHQDDYTYTEFNRSTIDWHDTDYILPGESLPIEVARGCIFKCTYCNYQLNGKTKNDYVKLEDILYTELMTNYQKYGTTNLMICDDLFNDTVDKVNMWHKISQKLPFRLEWSSYLRLDMLHAFPATIQTLADSGLRSCLFGIETLNDVAGKNVGKGLGEVRTFKTLENVRKIWKDNVHIGSGFIIGLPQESFESSIKTFEWALNGDLLDTFYFNPLMIFKSEFESTIQALGKDLSKWGYKIKKGGLLYELWYNDTYTYEEAANLSWQLHVKHKRTGRYSHPNFTTRNRVQNLGISFDKNVWINQHDFIVKKTIEKELEYFRKLFSGLGLTPPTELNYLDNKD